MAHYFLAIPVPSVLQETYSKWQKELDEILPYQRWMHPEDLHLTLKFFGEIADSDLSFLIKNISKQVYPKSFIIELGSLGFFGHKLRPRVLWVDVKITERLEALQTIIEDAMASIGFPKEIRPYKPHVTLAKKWGSDTLFSEKELNELVKRYQGEQRFLADSFILYRIRPGQVPSYEIVAIFPLLGC